METEQASRIAELNDEFRRKGNSVTVTPGIQVIEDLSGLLEDVRWFSDFNEDNDPWAEHDFGCVYWRDKKVFWKIDYFNHGLNGWCDPLSPECRRVLTVMLASEY